MPVNNTEPLSIYRAGPGHATCLAKMILAASRGLATLGFLDEITQLPEPLILELLAKLVVHPQQVWGRLEATLIALVDGVCAGTLTLGPHPGDEPYPLTPKAFLPVASQIGLSQDQTLAVLSRQEACLALGAPFAGQDTAKVWLVHFLGVRRANRGSGVARGLMRAGITLARKAGARRLELYLAQNHPRIRGLLTSLDFTSSPPNPAKSARRAYCLNLG